MGEVVNFRQARKGLVRKAAEQQAAENRARFEQRANNSFKYATSEQRVERARRSAERKLRQQAAQQQGRRY